MTHPTDPATHPTDVVTHAPDALTHTPDTEPLTATLRVRIGQEDAHYGGHLVDGARVLRLFGDLVTEITIRSDGDEGLLSEYADIHFHAPVHPGDYIEASASVTRRTKLRRFVELRAVKVIAACGGSPSAARVLPEPVTVCTARATTVVPKPTAVPKRTARSTARVPVEERAPAPAGGR
ncbi:hotdog fold domain-containing protein [Streptomyces sp. NPDC087917]|uniref:hotdog fold domain-containing protein n=1 Tax=unclassified Streptomyces TaxID=2593676 RepID=UPI00341D9A6C